MLQKHSLVIYKNRPAVVTQMGKKITLLLESGETLQVRPKDVTLIHPGPLESLSGLSASPEMGAELQAAWELLSGTTTPLRAVADIGTHWLDLIHSLTGLEVEALCADLCLV